MNIDRNNLEETRLSSPLAELAKKADQLNNQELNASLDKKSISENEFLADNSDQQALKALGEDFYEAREFGLDKCSAAAKEIFNPGVIDNWMYLSPAERQEISQAYAAEVAEAFELEKYTGVIFEDLEPNVLGYNNGDGSIHLTNNLLADLGSPLDVVDTITHELRHQYQSECINGYHNVSDEVKNEWAAATAIYDSNSHPWAFDPWGYKYNPLEIDSRYAGETVVRNITKEFINDQLA